MPKLGFASLTALLALAAAGCSDPSITIPMTEADDGGIPFELREQYREDAARMALDIVRREQPLEEAPVEIPSGLRDDLYQALIHVHNADHMAARDTVIDVFRIHTTADPITREIILGVREEDGWPLRWKAGERRTGQPVVDSLLDEHSLELQAWAPEESSEPFAVFRADRPLNIEGLATHLEALEYFPWARAGWVRTVGQSIRARRVALSWEIEYTIRWSTTYHFGRNCTRLCFIGRSWHFRVSPEGEVRFAGSSGSPLPRR